MNNNSIIFSFIVTPLLLSSCGSNRTNSESMKDLVAVSVEKAPVRNKENETDDKTTILLPEQKFLRTATLKFQVKNVQQTAEYIEKKPGIWVVT
jgi:hypothetical protein